MDVYAMSTAIRVVVDALRELPPEDAGRVLVAAAVIVGREDLAKAMLVNVDLLGKEPP